MREVLIQLTDKVSHEEARGKKVVASIDANRVAFVDKQLLINIGYPKVLFSDWQDAGALFEWEYEEVRTSDFAVAYSVG